MSDENKIGYYAIIPSTVLFNEKIKANEKLLYAVITVLSNKEKVNLHVYKTFEEAKRTIFEFIES